MDLAERYLERLSRDQSSWTFAFNPELDFAFRDKRAFHTMMRMPASRGPFRKLRHSHNCFLLFIDVGSLQDRSLYSGILRCRGKHANQRENYRYRHHEAPTETSSMHAHTHSLFVFW